MSTRLDFVKYDEETNKLQQELKVLFQQLEDMIDDKFIASREKHLAITNLEQSWMWVGKALKIRQELK